MSSSDSLLSLTKTRFISSNSLIEHIVASPSISSPSSPPQPFPLYSLTKLPEPSLGNIDQVELSIRSIGRTAAGRERTAITIIKGNYIQKLIKIQEEAEDLESLEDLHALCRVMQTICESLFFLWRE